MADSITMKDGSTFKMEESWSEAVHIKYGHFTEEMKHEYAEVVAKHWDTKTIPTKFGYDEKWAGDIYKDQAELAPRVIYIDLRAVLMGMTLSRATGGEGKVIAMRPDGMKEYPSGKKVELEDLGKD